MHHACGDREGGAGVSWRCAIGVLGGNIAATGMAENVRARVGDWCLVLGVCSAGFSRFNRLKAALRTNTARVLDLEAADWVHGSFIHKEQHHVCRTGSGVSR